MQTFAQFWWSAGLTVAVTSCGSKAPSQTAPTQVSTAALATTPSSTPTPAGTMQAFANNGYELSGAEYWPNVGDRETAYPDEVLWGFYPRKGAIAPDETEPNVDTASPAAVACAEQAYGELVAFIANPPTDFAQIVKSGEAFGYTNKFYLWTNDYRKANKPFAPGMRQARLWFWKRKTPKPGRPAGFWKWESNLDQDGVCHTPKLDAANQYLATALRELNAAAPGTDLRPPP